MRRKNLFTALMCTVCLTAATIAPATVFAEEQTEAVTAAADDGADAAADGADAADDGADAADDGADAAADSADDGADAAADGADDGADVAADGADDSADDGADAADDAAGDTETEDADAEDGEEAVAPAKRPDYKALDYVVLGEYKGLTVVPPSTEATEEEVDSEIRLNIQLAGALETVEGGTVQDGDTVNIDYEGKKDGEAFDGGTAKGYDLEIGSHLFIDGFEAGLVGVNAGETVDLPLSFPENYFSEELAGQEVVFTVTVNEIKRAPELSDELASKITDGEYADVASYRAHVREELEKTKETERSNQIKSDLLTQIANTSGIKDYPQEMVDFGAANMKSYYKQQAEAYSMEFAEFLDSLLGITEEEFDEQVEMAIKQNMQQELYLKAIAETEGIELTDEEYTGGCETLAADYNYDSADEFVAAYGEDTIRVSLLQEKVLDFLVDNAVIQEESESESETGTTEAVTE